MAAAEPGTTNWSGNIRWGPVEVVRPATTDDLRATLSRARRMGRGVRPAGSRHSFTPLCATDGISLELGCLAGILDVDPEGAGDGRGASPAGGAVVTVGAGTPLHELNVALDRLGLAVANLGDIDRQTVSGAISTGTHGTGAGFGGLASQVQSLALVTPGGDEVRCSATVEPDLFHAATVGLGAFGVVTEVALRTVPAFGLHQVVESTSYHEVMDSLGDRTAEDHFEFFWFPLGDVVQSKTSRRMDPDEPTAPMSPVRHYLEDVVLENAALGAMCRLGRRRPDQLPRLHAAAGRVMGGRVSSDASFRMFATTRSVRFLESEYAIPREALPEVLDAVGELARRLPVGPAFPVEVRFAAADDVWLSTGYGRANAYVAVHQYVGMPHERYFAEFAEICAAVDGRPHWGKMHPLGAAELDALYPRFSEAAALRQEIDPEGLFLNDHLRTVFGVGDRTSAG